MARIVNKPYLRTVPLRNTGICAYYPRAELWGGSWSRRSETGDRPPYLNRKFPTDGEKWQRYDYRCQAGRFRRRVDSLIYLPEVGAAYLGLRKWRRPLTVGEPPFAGTDGVIF